MAPGTTAPPRPLGKPVPASSSSPATPARASRSSKAPSKLSNAVGASPQAPSSRRTGESSQRRHREGQRGDSGVGGLAAGTTAMSGSDVGPTGTPGLLSLSKPASTPASAPGTGASTSNPPRRKAARQRDRDRERRTKVVKPSPGSGDEEDEVDDDDDAAHDSEEDSDEEEEEILFQPGQETVRPVRPAHTRTMSEPMSVTGGSAEPDPPPPAKREGRQGKQATVRKAGLKSKDALDKDMSRLSMTGRGPTVDAPVSSRTRRKQAVQTQTQPQTQTQGQGDASGPERTGQSSGDDARRRPKTKTKTVAIAIASHASPARGGMEAGASTRARNKASAPLSKSVPSAWMAQAQGQASATESGYDTAREGVRAARGPALAKGRRGKAGDDGDMMWEMPDLKEVKSDGSGLTWQQLELAGSPLDPRRAGKTARSSGLPASTSSPSGHLSRRGRVDALPLSASEREDAAPANARRRARGTTTESQEDSDVFPPAPGHPELRKSKTIGIASTGTPRKAGPSPAVSTPQRERPGPAHIVSAPAQPVLRGTPLSAAVYAGPKFHNSPSAEHLPAPRLLRE